MDPTRMRNLHNIIVLAGLSCPKMLLYKLLISINFVLTQNVRIQVSTERLKSGHVCPLEKVTERWLVLLCKKQFFYYILRIYLTTSLFALFVLADRHSSTDDYGSIVS